METIKAIAHGIQKANHIAVLTGAGVSTTSGIPDFRSAGGFWEEDHSREYYMSSDYFHRNPTDFWKKYKSIFSMKLLGTYSPNPVHYFLHALENEGKSVSVITQNVDGLHSQAGNNKVVEYHGSLRSATCPLCKTQYNLSHILNNELPKCSSLIGEERCNEILKPDVVLFGDLITEHDTAEAIIDQADFLLVLGTSLFVMPFNFLPEYAKYTRHLPTAIINREPTPKDYLFDFVVHDELLSSIKKLKALIS